MDLVENDVLNILQARRSLENQVAKNFGGHDEQPRLGVDGHVAGLDAGHLVAEPFAEIPVFLVRERLDRRSVYRAFSLPQSRLDRVFGKERFSAAGRGRDDEGISVINSGKRLFLKRVELKVEIIHGLVCFFHDEGDLIRADW
jgi:hypothetical protein